ncbi:MAG: hypothetical protein WD646_00800 [Actinomycetota bacterium]
MTGGGVVAAGAAVRVLVGAAVAVAGGTGVGVVATVGTGDGDVIASVDSSSSSSSVINAETPASSTMQAAINAMRCWAIEGVAFLRSFALIEDC